MKAEFEVLRMNAEDVITASNGEASCPPDYEACPGLMFDDYASEG